MPLISTFGAASARAFGLQASSKEEPGSWFAPEGQDLAASYEPAGYSSVTITIVGVNGGSGYGGSNRRWVYAAGTQNEPQQTPGNKVGRSSMVSGSVSPANLAFRTVQANYNNNINNRGWTSGSAANNYSGSRAAYASAAGGVYSGTTGGGAVVAYHGNTRIAVAAGGGASGRADRNQNYYGNSYSALTHADASNNNVTNSNNGTNTQGGACYYSSGGSGGGEKGGATTPNPGNKGGYSGNSYSTGLTLTAGAFQDQYIGSNESVGYAKVEWS